MRTIILGVLMLATIAAAEEIAELEANGRLYKNAVISSIQNGVAIVRHDGGIARVPVEDLPEQIKSRLPAEKTSTSPAATEEDQAKAEEIKRKMAEHRAAMAQAAAWRGEPTLVTVRVINSNGSCLVNIDGEGAKEIRITRIPSTVGKFFADIKSLDQRLITAADAVKVAWRAYEDVPVSMTGSPQVVAAWEARVKRARDNLRKAEDDFDALRSQREALSDQQKLLTSFLARKTAQVYAGYEIWEYHGPFK